MADAILTETSAPARLLLIDASRTMATRLAAALAADFAEPPVVMELACGRAGIELCKSSELDLVLASFESLADISAQADDRIARLARAAADALLIVVTAGASISTALSAMRAGAHECLDEGMEPDTLVRRIGDLARRHGKSRLVTRSARPVQMSPAAEVSNAAPSIPVMRDLVLPMWRQEQKIIEDAIESFAGNIAMAAAALELSPSTIYRKRQAWAEMNGERTA